MNGDLAKVCHSGAASMHSRSRIVVANEREMSAWVRRWADCLCGGETIFLRGKLGAGKTTLARFLLRYLGVREIVRSPTYSLIEHYETRLGPALHFDLYRVENPQELEFLGGRDLWRKRALRLVEWPQHGEPWLPHPHLDVHIEIVRTARIISCYSNISRLMNTSA